MRKGNPEFVWFPNFKILPKESFLMRGRVVIIIAYAKILSKGTKIYIFM